MRALGIILAGGKNERLKELTHTRALAAMPVAAPVMAAPAVKPMMPKK